MKKSKTPFLLKVIRGIFPMLEKFFPALAHRFFITIFFTPLRYPIPEKEKVVAADADKFTLRVGKRNIACYSWGQGPLILLVHGWAGRGTQFRKFIQALVREKFRVVAFDGPAHGQSDGRSTDIVEFGEVLKEIFIKVGTPEGIIAHSFGGGAVLFAAMNGLPVSKLINIGSPTIGDEIIRTYLRTINGSPSTGKFFKSYIQARHGKPFEEFTALHFIRHLRQHPDILLVHDEDDKEVPLKHALELMKQYPGAVLFKTTGLGHTRILKDERVIRRCISFLKA